MSSDATNDLAWNRPDDPVLHLPDGRTRYRENGYYNELIRIFPCEPHPTLICRWAGCSNLGGYQINTTGRNGFAIIYCAKHTGQAAADSPHPRLHKQARQLGLL